MPSQAASRELKESVLPDDYPVYGSYLYVADGKVIASNWHDITVGRLKRLLGAKEIRRCDMFGRGLFDRPWWGLARQDAEEPGA